MELDTPAAVPTWFVAVTEVLVAWATISILST